MEIDMQRITWMWIKKVALNFTFTLLSFDHFKSQGAPRVKMIKTVDLHNKIGTIKFLATKPHKDFQCTMMHSIIIIETYLIAIKYSTLSCLTRRLYLFNIFTVYIIPHLVWCKKCNFVNVWIMHNMTKLLWKRTKLLRILFTFHPHFSIY